MLSVFIITHCTEKDYLPGNTLIFKTARVGFPTAKIYILDNSSAMEARGYIKKCSDGINAKYCQLQQELQHEVIIEYLVNNIWEGTCILLDPDMCFWQNCEKWGFNALIAGRLIPRFLDDYSKCITAERIHTSFWWINDAGKLREAIKEIKTRYFDFHPFSPYMYQDERGQWIRYDTGASLYAALINRMQGFTHAELRAYDHLFCGTNYKEVAAQLDNQTEFLNIHKQAIKDHRKLRGIWKRQEDYFRAKESNPRAKIIDHTIRH